MDILLWLVPPVVVTVLAMVLVTWLGRHHQREVDRDVAVQKLAKALRKEHPGLRRPGPATSRPRDRSTGIAVRPSARSKGPAARRTHGDDKRTA